MTTAADLPGPAGVEPLAQALDFEEFARRQGPRLRRFVHRRVRDWHEAEEIAQETLLRAYQHLDEFSSDAGAAAWCTTVARRLVIDRIRVIPRSMTVAEVPETARQARDVADVAAARADARLALDVLDALPERQAAALWAREIEGLSYDQISRRLSLTEPAVRSLLHRGRAALRDNYLARGGTLPLAVVLPVLACLRRLGRSAAQQAPLVLAAAVAIGLAFGLAPSKPDQVVAPATQRPAVTAAVTERPSSAGRPHLAARSPGVSAPASSASGWGDVSVCTATRSTGACLQREQTLHGTRVTVDVPVPLPAAVADQLAVSTTLVGGCEQLPTTPITHCTTDPSTTGGSP